MANGAESAMTSLMTGLHIWLVLLLDSGKVLQIFKIEFLRPELWYGCESLTLISVLKR